MNELQKRVLTGLIGGGLFLWALCYSPISCWILFNIIGLFCLIEFYSLFNKNNYHISILPGVSIHFFLSFYLFFQDTFIGKEQLILALFSVLSAGLLLIEITKKSKSPIQNMGITLGGIAYIILRFTLGALLNLNQEEGPSILLGTFLLIWMNDSTAYFTGKSIGKHLLFERLSPKKTWEGFLGGFFFTLISAALFFYINHSLTLILWISIAIIISSLGTLGDLVESMFKRSLSIKDSGSILPGHGGFLDRFDSYLIAFPFVYFIVALYFNYML